MLSAEARSRLSIVLVGARNPQNIGAAARAMQDFGFQDLRVVNEFAPPFEAARLEATSAVGAGEVMRTAQLFPDLPEAIANCTLVAGTTAIGGRGLSRPVLPLLEAAPLLLAGMRGGEENSSEELAQAKGGSRVALLFGSEKTGLTNEQLSFCSHLVTIPMFAPEGRHLSMNLGQSVAVCLYELTREGLEGGREWTRPQTAPSTVADRERLLSLLLDAMHACGYADRFPANVRPVIVRQLVDQLGRSREEAATWMGFLRLALRGLTSGATGETSEVRPE